MSNIRLGISSCLCGNKVRHDGSSKRNVYAMEKLSEYFEFQPFCPEMAAGLGVPRLAMRLKRKQDGIRLVASKDYSADYTDALISWTDEHRDAFRGLSGFALKNSSPSCGMARVKVYDQNDVPKKQGVGIFTRRLMRWFPLLPLEEEGRLNDPVLRENFIQRVYVYNRWQNMMRSGLSVSSLMEFHARHKFILLAHDEVCYRQLGPFIAQAGTADLATTADEYILRLMTALKLRASRKKHTNVLMHIFGFIKQELETGVKHEILNLLENYRQGQVPLVVPLTMIRHYLNQYPDEYMAKQYYMQPYPDELMLRNNV